MGEEEGRGVVCEYFEGVTTAALFKPSALALHNNTFCARSSSRSESLYIKKAEVDLRFLFVQFY
jgi:hypothetical protein